MGERERDRDMDIDRDLDRELVDREEELILRVACLPLVRRSGVTDLRVLRRIGDLLLLILRDSSLLLLIARRGGERERES